MSTDGQVTRREVIGAFGVGLVLSVLPRNPLNPAESIRPDAGSLKAAMWVHGTIVEAENPASFISRKGWGTTFGGQNTFNWFHIPITTPVILDDIRPTLVKVFVLYKTNGAVIRNLHIYDGGTKVKLFDNLNLSGDHTAGIDASNSWVITPPLGVAFGLGISVGVQFGVDPSDILFTAAGMDFQTP